MTLRKISHYNDTQQNAFQLNDTQQIVTEQNDCKKKFENFEIVKQEITTFGIYSDYTVTR